MTWLCNYSSFFWFFLCKNNSWTSLIYSEFGGRTSNDSEISFFLLVMCSKASFFLVSAFSIYYWDRWLKFSPGTSYPLLKSAEFLQTMVKKELALNFFPWLMFTSISIDVFPVLLMKPWTWMSYSELIGSKNSRDWTEPVTKVNGLFFLNEPKECL